ncbi:MAG: FtsX-like permease family protein [Pseudomonadota bacterium]
MSIASRLAWRNLWRHGRRTWLTVGAMVFCNGLLVFLVAFQFGTYGLMIESSLAMLTAHVQVQHEKYLDEPRMRYTVPDGIKLAAQLRENLPDAAVAARAGAFALASSEERSFGIEVLGVEPEFEAAVSSLPGLVSEGRYLGAMNAEEIVIGTVLASNLKVAIGDEITLLGSGRDGSFAAGIATVVGLIDTGLVDLDRAIAALPLGYFQSIFSMEGAVHKIVIHVPTLPDVAPAEAQLRAELGQTSLAVRDWNELQPGLRQAILADSFSAVVMYGVLVILVAFSVLNTQLMSVLERTREFGVMMALGLRPSGLSRLVLLETASMALLGTILGCLLGGAVTAYFMFYGLSLPGMEEAMSQYNLPSTLHPELNLYSLLLGPAVVLIGSLLAAIYPALRIYVLQPVSAMRAV